VPLVSLVDEDLRMESGCCTSFTVVLRNYKEFYAGEISQKQWLLMRTNGPPLARPPVVLLLGSDEEIDFADIPLGSFIN
jgi:hypothetical protein